MDGLVVFDINTSISCSYLWESQEVSIPLAHRYQRRFIMVMTYGRKPKEETRESVLVTMEFEIKDGAEIQMHPDR